MKPLLSPRVVLLVAAIVFVALMIWVRTHPEKPDDPVMESVEQLWDKLGLRIQPVPGGPGGGLPVNDVKAGSPADRVGFRKGDRILAVGDRSVWHSLMFSEQLNQNLSQGRPFSVLVDSNGSYHGIIMGRALRGGGGAGEGGRGGERRGRGR